MQVECPRCKTVYGKRKGYAVQCKKCGDWLKSESEKRTQVKHRGYRRY